jgi:D-xylose 1-dehydrogenase (NADP+, D-xylono-1,5-lactone-forming)
MWKRRRQMAKEPVRLGMVGCGQISHTHAAAAKVSGHARFDACCDVRANVAQTWAERHGAHAFYTDYTEMIRREALDGVYLATWPSQHREQVERCLEAGARNILCEKPLALSAKDALEMWQLVKGAGAFLMEGLMYRHHPGIRKMEAILAQGDIGAVDHVRAVYSYDEVQSVDPRDPNRVWRLRRELGGGAPYATATYPVNACTHFSGGVPIRVFATGRVNAKHDVIDRCFGTIEYDNGCVGIVEVSWTIDGSQELEITCSHGTLWHPWTWTTLEPITIEQRHSHRSSSFLTDTYQIPKEDPYRLELDNFVGVIHGETEPRVLFAESVANSYVIEALATAIRERKAAIELDIPEPVVRELRGRRTPWR